ncbi:MAG: peptidylprolyl isomerase, partial [Saezia sp.]
ATNNNKTVGQLRKDFASAGIPFSTLEKSIEQQMLARMLRERLLDPTIYVNSSEIDAYLAQASKATNSSELMISLAQILIAVPENATKKQDDALREKAQDIYKKVQQIKSIQDFIELVKQYSDDPNKERTSGALGVMPVSAYPDIFIQAVNGLKAGEVASPVRSGAGYHILLLIDKEQSDMIVEQTHARHILLNISDTQTEEAAIQILLDDKRKIESGQVSFEILAQEQSQDASAKDGGDLGWVVQGMFVPEFDAVMNQLKPGEISNPVVTRFGVHLIQVLERRDAELTMAQKREVAREVVHQRKVQEAYEQWVQSITGQSYIEIRELPR